MLPYLVCLLLLLQAPPSEDGAAPPSAPAPDTTSATDNVTDQAAAARQSGQTPAAPSDLTQKVVDHLERIFRDTSLVGWTILLAGIFLGLLGGFIVQRTLRDVSTRLKQRGWIARGSLFDYVSGPVKLAIFAAGLAFGFTGVALGKEVGELVGNAIGLLYVVALAWFLYNLVDIVEIGIRRITTDNTILQLIRKALRIFLLIIFGLFVAENFFGANISAWLAGLGLAGLAVSLAAQGPIKNIFGSVTVVLDRPFGLGDRITFGDKTGIVEVMGFRSTKLRTMDGHLVTIPNSKLIEDVVENITARPYIRRVMNVTITYDTPPERVEQAVHIIRDLLAQPFMAGTFNMTDFPPRVYFNNFNADSLNIMVAYWYQLNLSGPEVRDWWTFNAQAQEFNFKLLRAYKEAGIDFAFPTQTIYLAGDTNRELAIRLTPETGPIVGS